MLDYMNQSVGWGHWIMMLIFWGVLIFIVVVAVRALSRRSDNGAGSGARSAMDVLKERYARGEIGKEEFEQKKSDLQS